MVDAGNRGLVGHTGFVGGILKAQSDYSHLYNSRNIDGIAQSPDFQRVVCAAAPGSMIEANRRPEEDARRIAALIERLDQLRTREFVLISSIAVFDRFDGGQVETSTAFQTEIPYGRNRRTLEEFCADRFDTCLIVRLPALFGPGLRKNFLFDLLNPVPSMLPEERLATLTDKVGASQGSVLALLYLPDAATGLLRLDRQALNSRPDRQSLEEAVEGAGFAAVGFHSPETTYQYYDMTELTTDIERAIGEGLQIIHLAPEPLAAAAIHERLLGRPMPETAARVHREDMRTRHAGLWNRSGPYIADAPRVLDRIEAFFRQARRAA